MAKTDKLLIFLSGIALGTAAGMLFAPNRGTKTRKRLAKRMRSLGSDLADKTASITGQVKNGFAHVAGNGQ